MWKEIIRVQEVSTSDAVGLVVAFFASGMPAPRR